MVMIMVNIAEAKAKGVKPAGGGGFAYMQGPDGAIVEYLGDLPAEVSTADDRQARQALLKVLGHAARADAGDRALAVRVLEATSSTQQIAMAALGTEPLRDEQADMSYEDWRVELMSLVSVET